MSTLTFPTIYGNMITSGRFSLIHNTQTSVSPLNKTTQTVESPGARWIFSYTWSHLNADEIAEFKAFLSRLRGQAGRFYMNDRTCDRRGSATLPGAVKGASQSGNTLVTDGWAPSQASLFLPGDYFKVGSELKIITATCASDAAGESTLTFEPPLRTSPGDNVAIIVDSPTAIFKLVGDDADNFNVQSPNWADFELQGEEVF